MIREVQRGEIYWLDWNPGKGSEQQVIRPSLVIQNNTGNKYSPNTIIAAILPSSGKVFPFQVLVSPQESGLSGVAKVNLAMVITVDKSRLGEKCGELTPAKMAEVDRAIQVSLGM
jgi:mRNA interferase MazF